MTIITVLQTAGDRANRGARGRLLGAPDEQRARAVPVLPDLADRVPLAGARVLLPHVLPAPLVRHGPIPRLPDSGAGEGFFLFLL